MLFNPWCYVYEPCDKDSVVMVSNAVSWFVGQVDVDVALPLTETV